MIDTFSVQAEFPDGISGRWTKRLHSVPSISLSAPRGFGHQDWLRKIILNNR